MTQKSFTIYKLIVLYMLDRVTFPLTRAQISDFILEKTYTDFLTLQQAIAELEEENLITTNSLRNRTYLMITDEGRETLAFFGSRIHHGIKEEVDQYLQSHALELRNEVSVQAVYRKSAKGEFVAEVTATENGSKLISLQLTVPLEEMAVSICDNWQEKNQEIYKYLTEMLF